MRSPVEEARDQGWIEKRRRLRPALCQRRDATDAPTCWPADRLGDARRWAA